MIQQLKKVFKTETGQPFIFSGSGTGAWEAALTNTLSPGDKVLAPAAGLFSFLVLLFGIVQIGPSVILVPLIIWSWFAMDTTMAILFTLYMVPVNLMDNILRPLVAIGLKTPMPVILIGVLGGTLVHGMIGLFVGPIVLSVAWQLLAVWTHDAP